MENFERILHREVKADGGTALAKRMGVNETTLLDCANPNRASHKMNLQMFGMVLTHLSGSGRMCVLRALANEFDCEVISRERPEPRQLMAALGHFSAECGDVNRLVFDAVSDNHISQSDIARTEREIQQAIDSLLILQESMRARRI